MRIPRYRPFSLSFWYVLLFENALSKRSCRRWKNRGKRSRVTRARGRSTSPLINMEAYTQQHFGMFSGEKKRVSLRFTNNLLDTMVDRFGTGADVSYYADGERHFVVNTEIAISDQFFGWLCGFRKMAKIVSPPSVVEAFQNFLDDIYGRYDVD